MVGELSQGLAVIKHEQEYMEVRERIHRMSELVDIMEVPEHNRGGRFYFNIQSVLTIIMPTRNVQRRDAVKLKYNSLAVQL